VPLAALRAGLVHVIACAVSTYAWLIGSAELLLGTRPRWLAVLVLAAGCAAVPWWWRALRDKAA
jgi:hypothetical protein